VQVDGGGGAVAELEIYSHDRLGITGIIVLEHNVGGPAIAVVQRPQITFTHIVDPSSVFHDVGTQFLQLVAISLLQIRLAIYEPQKSPEQTRKDLRIGLFVARKEVGEEALGQ